MMSKWQTNANCWPAPVKQRHQRGYVYRKGDAWYVRFNEREEADGAVRIRQRAHKLAQASGEYRTLTAARALAEEFLAPVNQGRTPGANLTLGRFVSELYLPAIEQQKRASTYHGYRNLWRSYLAPHGGLLLREFRTADGERILAAVARERELSVTTLRHVKALLSGIFRYAKRQGMTAGENPIREAAIPQARGASETHAYDLETILRIIETLDEPAATIVAVAAFTGVRKGELRGLCWEDYDGAEIRVARSWWRHHVSEPKTAKSKASVPVIAQLRDRLERHRTLVAQNFDHLPIFAVYRGNGPEPVEPRCAGARRYPASPATRRYRVARLARFPPRAGHQPSPPGRPGQSDPAYFAALECQRHPSLLHQVGRRGRSGGDD